MNRWTLDTNYVSLISGCVAEMRETCRPHSASKASCSTVSFLLTIASDSVLETSRTWILNSSEFSTLESLMEIALDSSLMIWSIKPHDTCITLGIVYYIKYILQNPLRYILHSRSQKTVPKSLNEKIPFNWTSHKPRSPKYGWRGCQRINSSWYMLNLYIYIYIY